MSPFADLDRLKVELDALRPLAPEQEARVLQKFRLDWNYNSNAIEENSLSLGETRSLLLHGLTAAGKPLRDHIDIEATTRRCCGWKILCATSAHSPSSLSGACINSQTRSLKASFSAA
jgi:hypothetical protein